MYIEHFFGGSALKAVGRDGRVRLPRFVRTVAGRRAGDGALVIGVHDSDPCLTAYDRGFRGALFADAERARLREEETGGDSHRRRARRAFGLTEEAEVDPAGTILLPAMMRRFGRIEGLALFVGTGGSVEIWNPELAAESDDPALSELARWRLDHDDPVTPGQGAVT